MLSERQTVFNELPLISLNGNAITTNVRIWAVLPLPSDQTAVSL